MLFRSALPSSASSAAAGAAAVARTCPSHPHTVIIFCAVTLSMLSFVSSPRREALGFFFDDSVLFVRNHGRAAGGWGLVLLCFLWKNIQNICEWMYVGVYVCGHDSGNSSLYQNTMTTPRRAQLRGDLTSRSF